MDISSLKNFTVKYVWFGAIIRWVTFREIFQKANLKNELTSEISPCSVNVKHRKVDNKKCYRFEAWHMELHWENCVIMIKIILVTYPICHKKEKEFSRVWKGSTGS